MSEYHKGKEVAKRYKHLPQNVIGRLKQSAEFWQGFHDNRIRAPFKGPLEDPTRPGGWCHK